MHACACAACVCMYACREGGDDVEVMVTPREKMQQLGDTIVSVCACMYAENLGRVWPEVEYASSTFAYTYIRTYIHTCKYVYVNTFVCVCTYVCVCMKDWQSQRAHLNAYPYIYIHTENLGRVRKSRRAGQI
jgi:hypothetical protein